MISVRAAKPSDAAALVAHLKELAAEPGINIPLAPDEVTLTVADEREILEDLEDNDRAAMFVAVGDGAIVGELTVKGISPRRAVKHVATLGMSVKQTWRGRGVGLALMNAAIEWARAAGFTRLELNVYARNAPAIRLYQRCGFAIEGTRKRFIREGDTYLDDLVMARLE
jgi:RimJ/RimL family protein N-acetyltransferase